MPASFPSSTFPPVSRRAVAGGIATLLLAAGHGQAVAQASPVAFVKANLFSFTGEGVEVDFSTSSIAGEPQLTCRGSIEVSASGDEITIEELAGSWPLGTLVTVLVDAIPDAEARTVSLLVPHVNITGGDEPVSTIAIVTTNRSSFTGPGGVDGQIQSYEVIALDGTAQAVVF